MIACRWKLLVGVGMAWAMTAVFAHAEPAFDGARAFVHLETLCAFGPRVPGSAAQRDARDYLLRTLDLPGARVRTQAFHGGLPGKVERVPLFNVCARFGPPGVDPLVVGAHWDCRFAADLEPDSTRRDEPVPGANDGASGAAVLLELARLMSEEAPPRAVELVFFDGEDQGTDEYPDYWLQGSRYYVSVVSDSRPAGMILVDMVGDRDLEIPKEGYSVKHAEGFVEAFWQVARRLGATPFAEYVGQEVYDDHVPFLEAGITAICLIDFTYSKWHTLSDLPDACSPRSLRTVGQVLTAFIYAP